MKYKIKLELSCHTGDLVYVVYTKSFFLWNFQTFERTAEKALEYVDKLKKTNKFIIIKGDLWFYT